MPERVIDDPVESVSDVTAATFPVIDDDTASGPQRPGEEWANALSHGIATLIAVALGIHLVSLAAGVNTAMAIACGAYSATVVGTFLCSTLSHIFQHQPWLNRFRTWDQAMIYLMITGTYTPMVIGHAPDGTRGWLVAAIWIAAIAGVMSKIAKQHRINSISTVTYLLLGWLPAIPLIGHVPSELAWGMLAGGILYTIGVAFLVNDSKVRYMHVVWHAFVMLAAWVHYWSIKQYVVGDLL